MTFGNDKIITNKNFRPSFGIAEGDHVKVVGIPIKSIEKSVHIIANTGENKEKFDFFKKFPWYDNYTQSMRSKYNNSFKKITFYPGQKLISEGQKEKVLFIIVDGLCNLVCTNTSHKLKDLEIEDDPSKA